MIGKSPTKGFKSHPPHQTSSPNLSPIFTIGASETEFDVYKHEKRYQNADSAVRPQVYYEATSALDEAEHLKSRALNSSCIDGEARDLVQRVLNACSLAEEAFTDTTSLPQAVNEFAMRMETANQEGNWSEVLFARGST